jgi:hypothetical protein
MKNAFAPSPALFALLALPWLAHAQPGVCFVNGVTSGCSTSAAQNPTQLQFVQAAGNAVNAAAASIAALPQPKIPFGAGCPGCSTSFVTADPTGGPYIFSNVAYEEAFINTGLVQLGASLIFVNAYPDAWLASSYYAGACTATNPAKVAYLLTFYRAIGLYAKAHSLTLDLSFAPALGTTWASCAISNPGGMSVATMDAALGPMYAAAIADYNNIGVTVHIAIVAHEPTGLWATQAGQTFSTTDFSTACGVLSGAVLAATGGSGVLTGCGYTHTETLYVTALIAANSPNVLVVGVDLYFGADYTTWSTGFSHAATIMQEAVAWGRVTGLDETDSFRWCPAGGGSCNESQVYFPCNVYAAYTLTGVQQAFSSIVAPFVSANGGTYLAPFTPQPWIQNATGAQLTSTCEDSSSTGNLAIMLQSVPSTPTIAGNAWQVGSTWSSTSWQGFTVLNGVVSQ